MVNIARAATVRATPTPTRLPLSMVARITSGVPFCINIDPLIFSISDSVRSVLGLHQVRQHGADARMDGACCANAKVLIDRVDVAFDRFF